MWLACCFLHMKVFSSLFLSNTRVLNRRQGTGMEGADYSLLEHRNKSLEQAHVILREIHERIVGIEPTPLAWKAKALPLCNIRGTRAVYVQSFLPIE